MACTVLQIRQLQQQLAAREDEVAALREIAEAASELQSQDVQASKVIELSKKVCCHSCKQVYPNMHAMIRQMARWPAEIPCRYRTTNPARTYSYQLLGS